jgi:CBS domain-containing protein
MADSSPPKSSDPGDKTSEPPPSSEPEPKPSDEEAAESSEGEDSDPDVSVDSGPNGIPSGRISLVELEIEPDPSVSGKAMPSKPPPAPTKRSPSEAKEDGRKLPEPAFKSQVPKPRPAIKQSMVPPRKFPPETVGDVMTRKLIALTEADTVENIETGMQRFRFRHLPVVTKENRLIGLVTHRDMMRAEAAAAADGEEGLPKDTPVGDVMNRDILTTRPGTDLVTAGKAMLQKKIGCLPIILEDETLVGIITEADFVKIVVQMLAAMQGESKNDDSKDDDED